MTGYVSFNFHTAQVTCTQTAPYENHSTACNCMTFWPAVIGQVVYFHTMFDHSICSGGLLTRTQMQRLFHVTNLWQFNSSDILKTINSVSSHNFSGKHNPASTTVHFICQLMCHVISSAWRGMMFSSNLTIWSTCSRNLKLTQASS